MTGSKREARRTLGSALVSLGTVFLLVAGLLVLTESGGVVPVAEAADASDKCITYFFNFSHDQSVVADGHLNHTNYTEDGIGGCLTSNTVTVPGGGPEHDPTTGTFILHVSCSSDFDSGYATKDGPVSGLDTGWYVESWGITKWKYDADGVPQVTQQCGSNPGPTPPTTTTTSTSSTTSHPGSNVDNVTLIKVVNGGPASPDDFDLRVGGASVLSGVLNVGFASGKYEVTEGSVPGYTTTGDWTGDCKFKSGKWQVSLKSSKSGGSSKKGGGKSPKNKVCTIVNNYQLSQPLLTVTKVVNGGTAMVSDFNLFVDATGVTSGVQNTFAAGTYTVSETGPSNYTAVYSGDCDPSTQQVTMVDNDPANTYSCVITNTYVPSDPLLTVTKVIDNHDHGTAMVSDWSFAVSGTPVNSGVQNTFSAGTYTVFEVGGPTNYVAVISGDCAANGSITLVGDDVKACVITNTYVPSDPLLTVTKVIDNHDHGTAIVSDFNLFVDATGVTSGIQNSFNAGTYLVSETGGPANYVAVISGDCAANGSITLVGDDVKACVITNTFTPPTPNDPKLTVTKVVVNVGGGTAVINDFPLFVDSTGVTSGVQNTFAAGTYTVSEITLPDYVAVISGDCAANGSITLVDDDVKACVITNTYRPPELTITKTLDGDDGPASIDDFVLLADKVGGATYSFTSGVATSVPAGSYIVREDGNGGPLPAGYTGVINDDCAADGSITMVAGGSYSCSIVNTYTEPTLKVTKVVENGAFGTAHHHNFELLVDADPVDSGATNDFPAGTYTVSEGDGPDGYTAVISGDCDPNGDVTLVGGDVKECVITNTFVPPTLKVTKVVENGSYGTAVPSDFTLKVDGLTVISGATNDFAEGTYTVFEIGGPSGYTAVISGSCDPATGQVTLTADGRPSECVITNTVDPRLTLIKTVIGGDAVAADFNLEVFGRASTTPMVSGVPHVFAPGLYGANETLLPGYNASIWTGDCEDDGSTELEPGNDYTCRITNTDPLPKLTLVKVIIGTGGGLGVNDFGLTVTPVPSGAGTAVNSGEKNNFAFGSYIASEVPQPGYTTTGIWTGDCDADGSIILPEVTENLSQSEYDRTCFITNVVVPTPPTTGGTTTPTTGGTTTTPTTAGSTTAPPTTQFTDTTDPGDTTTTTFVLGADLPNTGPGHLLAILIAGLGLFLLGAGLVLLAPKRYPHWAV